MATDRDKNPGTGKPETISAQADKLLGQSRRLLDQLHRILGVEQELKTEGATPVLNELERIREDMETALRVLQTVSDLVQQVESKLY